ncbi:MAG: molybdenum cofactor biosynthesis protein MoaE [Proteobacteria bacterium]|nr:molybdenum cofactor biosynthesis protein MoaE [Pseudomonadota bacterium]MDA0915440.1 molybdenum cofactor biosynthesis protein MoaE [Pseudomonadota bacterium]MDA1031756.1 molybdenum cofactor biosynthesis protein MoaE [Pseudomonadota bacterium]
MRDVGLLADAFDPGALVEQFRAANPGLGGICTFVGEVRSDTCVEVLELSHYEPLTLPSMEELADKAFARFDLMGLLMVHRVGQMLPGEPIVCVSAAAKHRREAIDAVDYCMDHLKAAAWLWKREKRDDEWSWIEPRNDDYDDLARWK